MHLYKHTIVNLSWLMYIAIQNPYVATQRNKYYIEVRNFRHRGPPRARHVWAGGRCHHCSNGQRWESDTSE